MNYCACPNDFLRAEGPHNRDSATETLHWEDPSGLVPLRESDWLAELTNALISSTLRPNGNAPCPKTPEGLGAGSVSGQVTGSAGPQSSRPILFTKRHKAAGVPGPHHCPKANA